MDKTFRYVQKSREFDQIQFYWLYQGSMNDMLASRFWLADRGNIKLTYQVRLRERLQLHLPVKSTDNAHVVISGVTTKDLSNAAHAVMKAENDTFPAYLACSLLWQNYLRRNDVTGFAATRLALRQSLASEPTHGRSGAAQIRKATQRHFDALTRRYLKKAGQLALLVSPWASSQDAFGMPHQWYRPIPSAN